MALGALMVATASATQDIVIDTFRVESLAENEQAAGMASCVAAYRVGMLVSTAGALYRRQRFRGRGATPSTAPGCASYIVMAALVGHRGRDAPCCRNRAGEIRRGRAERASQGRKIAVRAMSAKTA